MGLAALVTILAFTIQSFGQAAHDQFNRGIIALHNSAYDTAAEYFQAAEKLDPSFVMAYWGEAMTYNHPFAAEQDIASARRALSKLAPTRPARAAKAKTQRERDYLDAVEILYGDGGKDTRDSQYAAAMEKLAADYPGDMEAAAFRALALLGTLRYGDRTFGIQTKAASIAKTILQRKPDHPGALHYLIHAYDDPQHAHLALEASRRYERIADPNSHALHMPSHIYMQLGMWQDAARANQAAFDTSDRHVKLKRLSLAKRDYHSLEWLMYAEIQMGQYRKAREHAALMLQSAQEARVPGMTGVAAIFASRFAVETREWEALAPYPVESHTAELLFAQGMAAISKGVTPTAAKVIMTLNDISQEDITAGRRIHASVVGSLSKELSAQLALSQKRFDDAEKLAAEAVQYESTVEFPSGPPDLIKPAYEFYGEILLALNKARQAEEQFSISLKRMPQRASSLLGLARARAMQKDMAGANQAYRELAEIWSNGDPKVRSVLDSIKE